MNKLLTAITLLCFSISAECQGLFLESVERPNFSGQWENLREVPFQRAIALGEKRFYSQEEANKILLEISQAQVRRDQALNGERPPPESGRQITNQADDDFDEFPTGLMQINGEYRTSIIIQPENGRIPRKSIVVDLYEQYRNKGFTDFDGPEFAGANERCIHFGSLLPFMSTGGLSKYGQIVQTEDFIMILGEYPYYPRIIPIKEQSGNNDFFLDKLPKWMGHSYAYWEEDTLRIVTSKFRNEHSNRRGRSLPVSSQSSIIFESYKLHSPSEILYRWEFTDENFLTEPIVGEVLLTRMTGGRRIYEYACHEGNYNLAMILAGARRTDWEKQQGLDQ